MDLIKAFGFHVTYAKQFNEQAAMVERSLAKINEYKQRKQLRLASFKENDADAANVLMQTDRKRRGPPEKPKPPPGIVEKP